MSQDCGASAGPNGRMGVSAGDSVHSSPQVFIIQRWFERTIQFKGKGAVWKL